MQKEVSQNPSSLCKVTHIAEMVRLAGWQHYHYKRRVCGLSVAVTDTAASVFAAELIAAYPDAKIVLNYRKDLDAWHESAVKIVSVNENWALYILSCLGKVPFWGWHVYERFMWPGLFRALDGNIETGIARNGKWVYKGM